jgi:hypothetical protein
MGIVDITDLARVSFPALFKSLFFQSTNLLLILSKIKLKSALFTWTCINGNPKYLTSPLAIPMEEN